VPVTRSSIEAMKWIMSWRIPRCARARALAREFAAYDLSPIFRSNGTSLPDSSQYQALIEGDFRHWRLKVDGLVGRPLDLSLDALGLMPARTQNTRHDCVEGWSAIGQWTGVPLSAVPEAATIAPSARFIVFHCADTLERGADPYYESIDLIDAFHPQTILAYELNGSRLPVANGAPLRLRVERQLGYSTPNMSCEYKPSATSITSVAAREGSGKIAGTNGMPVYRLE
jgi:DMSO/TMAO reductase YedYZ molybdopterin-dependent catalytic subunit